MNEKKCSSYYTAGKYMFKDLFFHLTDIYNVKKYQNVLMIREEKKGGVCFIFDYGIIVSWNLGEEYVQNLISETKKYEIDSSHDLLIEELSYIIAPDSSLKIHDDCIKLPNDDDEIKLALSQAIAQSTELRFFEKKIEKTIETTQHIPADLAKTGKIHLKNGEISKMRGELFLTKSDLNLHYDLLDEPEFFWEYPEHVQYYNIISDYLGIQTRIDIVNKRLEIINEIFDMLSEEQKHHHSTMLEWIVIGLILFEVCVTIYHELGKFF